MAEQLGLLSAVGPDVPWVARRNMRRVGKTFDRKRYVYFGPLKFHKFDEGLRSKVGSNVANKQPVIRLIDCGYCERVEAQGPRSFNVFVPSITDRVQATAQYGNACLGEDCLRERYAETHSNKVKTAAYRWLKSSVLCVDCGVVYEPESMQFDHLPEFDKAGEMSQYRSHSLQWFVDELTKCDVVCANCHAVRTVGRRDCSS